jgi:hypothetical protein
MNNYLRIVSNLLVVLLCSAHLPAGETLYNGIVLPDKWPPQMAEIPRADQLPRYLQYPLKVIPIDVGRQLFVDDFLIEQTTLTRQYHLAEVSESNPILKPEDSSIEVGGQGYPNAAPFSDGVWWDPADQLFKMWYLARNSAFTCYATSQDGIHWQRPSLEETQPKGSNVVLNQRGDSSTIWLDLESQDPARRLLMLTWRANQLHLRTSADGIKWGDPKWSLTRVTGDRSTFFYNPFRQVWVYSMRKSDRNLGRVRHYLETKDMLQPSSFTEAVVWTRADEFDRVQSVISPGTYPDLYNLDVTPYESLMLGLFNIQSVEHNLYPNDPTHPKVVHISLGYSRDGFHWTRPDRRAFLDIAKDSATDTTAWNRGNVQSVGGGCLVVGDKLYFYYSGRNSGQNPDNGAGMSTGLAFLRRDGFASMDAGAESGTLTTRPLTFKGNRLFVNVNDPSGNLRVEALTEAGQVRPGFELANCNPVSVDSTIQEVAWQNAKLATLAGQRVRFRFHLTNGQLYSFWVSPDASGASYGYVAAGGPGLTGNRDTVGKNQGE